jgi:hypothetical protein
MTVQLGLPPARHVEEMHHALAVADRLTREARRAIAVGRCRAAVAGLRAAAAATGNAEAHGEALPFGARRRRLLLVDVQTRMDRLARIEGTVARSCLLERGQP